MEDITPITNDTQDEPPASRSKTEIDNKKQKQSEALKKQVKKKRKKNQVKEKDKVAKTPILHPNDVPETLGNLNEEFYSADVDLVNQSGAMLALIQPMEETKNALVKKPYKHMKGQYCSIKANVNVSPLNIKYLEALNKKLQKPMQPPSRMGYLPILTKPNNNFFDEY